MQSPKIIRERLTGKDLVGFDTKAAVRFAHIVRVAHEAGVQLVDTIRAEDRIVAAALVGDRRSRRAVHDGVA